jgi:DNA polymerase-3 subunit gamma/tau
MLGLGDRLKAIELFEKILGGEFSTTLGVFEEIYSVSSDVVQLLHDLLDITHKTLSSKLLKNYSLPGYSKFQQEKIAEIAAKIPLNSLLRIWQFLSRNVAEINSANSQKMAFEVLLMRLCHLVALPNLQQILLNLDETKNKVAQQSAENNDELINEILRNFEGAKLVL